MWRRVDLWAKLKEFESSHELYSFGPLHRFNFESPRLHVTLQVPSERWPSLQARFRIFRCFIKMGHCMVMWVMCSLPTKIFESLNVKSDRESERPRSERSEVGLKATRLESSNRPLMDLLSDHSLKSAMVCQFKPQDIAVSGQFLLSFAFLRFWLSWFMVPVLLGKCIQAIGMNERSPALVAKSTWVRSILVPKRMSRDGDRAQ